MMSTSLMGQTGPLSEFAGFGNLAGAVTGFYELTGWPDRSPAGPFLAYTDYVAPRYTVAALLAALDWRRRTGCGQHLDLSQAEASIHFLAPADPRPHRQRRPPDAPGQRRPVSSHPHGVYRCAGDDAWVAIACETDDQRRGAGRRRSAASTTPRSRRGRRRGGRARSRRRCRRVGVPVHGVQNSGGVLADPQLVHRGHFLTVDAPGARQLHRRRAAAWCCRGPRRWCGGPTRDGRAQRPRAARPPRLRRGPRHRARDRRRPRLNEVAEKIG